jgi:hypothetical protein
MYRPVSIRKRTGGPASSEGVGYSKPPFFGRPFSARTFGKHPVP